MIYGLPHELEVNGVEHPIRTDFRDIMRILLAMNDPNLEDGEKVFVCLYVLYEDFEEIEEKDYEAAFIAASRFLDCGKPESKVAKKKAVVDFEQDAPMLIAAVNRVAGKEVRECEYLHWWTFMGYFMEIGECTYSTVLNLRSKKNEGRPLEKWEKKFWDDNKDICVIREKYSDEEIIAMDKLNKLLD